MIGAYCFYHVCLFACFNFNIHYIHYNFEP